MYIYVYNFLVGYIYIYIYLDAGGASYARSTGPVEKNEGKNAGREEGESVSTQPAIVTIIGEKG